MEDLFLVDVLKSYLAEGKVRLEIFFTHETDGAAIIELFAIVLIFFDLIQHH
jgi:hypothetical protein